MILYLLVDKVARPSLYKRSHGDQPFYKGLHKQPKENLAAPETPSQRARKLSWLYRGKTLVVSQLEVVPAAEVAI